MDNHDVGYKKPPKSGQFKKGQSGNPRGRPPAHLKMRTEEDRWKVLIDMINEKLPAKTAQGFQEMTTYEAVYKKLRQMALMGDKGAIRILIQEWEKALKAGSRKAAARAAEINRQADLLEKLQPGIFGKPDFKEAVTRFLQLMYTDFEEDPPRTFELNFFEPVKKAPPSNDPEE